MSEPAQEWTCLTDIKGVVGDESVGSQWTKICDAHNAALAAIAAERERCKAGGWLSREALDAYAETEAQLAVAVEALEKLNTRVLTREQKAIIDAALAKVKEGK